MHEVMRANNNGILQLFKGNWILQIMYFIMLFVSIWGYLTTYIVFVFCMLGLLCVPFKKYINKEASLLLLFSVFYCLSLLLSEVESWFNFASYLLGPVIFYVYGNWIVGKLRTPQNIALFWSISILLFSFVLYISALQDISQKGFVNITRSFPIWGMNTEHDFLSATLYGLVASLGLAGLPIFLYKNPLNRIAKYIFLLLFVLSLATVIHLVNRTGPVIAFVCLFVVTAYKFQKHAFKLLLAGLMIFVLVIGLLKLGIIDQAVFDAYSDRNEGVGEVGTAGGRLERWTAALQNLFKYPFGWNLDAPEYGYAHNLWLDIARVSGIFPFIFFVVATVISYRKFFRLLKLKDQAIVPLLLGLNVCFLLSAMVEPVIEAVPLYFYLYLMLWGMQNQVYSIMYQEKYLRK